MKQLLEQRGNLYVELTRNAINNNYITDYIKTMHEDHDDAFFVVNLSEIANRFERWKTNMPRVEPFYAVKCNDDLGILAVLAQLGTGFDCASQGEIAEVLGLGVSPDAIIYANPCKQGSHLRYAEREGVNMTTVDNLENLNSIKNIHPNAKIVVRMLPPDSSKAECQLGLKFGIAADEVPELLVEAKRLDLDVIGVSFHVGSNCWDPTAWTESIEVAKEVFQMGLNAGYQFNFLDIGGGFPGIDSETNPFEDTCSLINDALDMHFPESSGVRVIAEPGRYFATTASTLAVNVISKRKTFENGAPSFRYYLNDGVYGSFNCIMFDAVKEVKPEILRTTDDHKFPSSLWGPTCDCLDQIQEVIKLPELFIGDWLVFRNFGAYTRVSSTTFNGMKRAESVYVMQENQWWQLPTDLSKHWENQQEKYVSSAIDRKR